MPHEWLVYGIILMYKKEDPANPRNYPPLIAGNAIYTRLYY